MAEKSVNRQSSECVYCGKSGPLTWDHVPPKGIFPKPRPSDLIKVPSCKACHSENRQVSLDDEYFRLVLTIREDVANHPTAQQVLPTVLRSLGKPKKLRFTNALLASVKEVPFVTPLGVPKGTKPAYDVDLRRLDRVIERTCKGLFFHEKGYRLPPGYTARAYSEVGLANMDASVRDRFMQQIVRPLLQAPAHDIGERTFSYRVLSLVEDPNSTAWAMMVYERVSFFSMTFNEIYA